MRHQQLEERVRMRFYVVHLRCNACRITSIELQDIPSGIWDSSMTKRGVCTLCTEPAVSLRMPRKLKVLGTCAANKAERSRLTAQRCVMRKCRSGRAFLPQRSEQTLH